MNRTLAKETLQKIGEEVLVKGWVYVRRDHGKILFIDIIDRSSVLQAVFPLADLSLDQEELAKNLRPQDAISITGTVQKRSERSVNPNLETGTVEVLVKSLEVYSKSEPLPFDMSAPQLNVELPTLLDYRTLTLRYPKVKDIFEVQAAIVEGFRMAAQKHRCVEVVVPTVSASSTEGGAEVFKVNYYDRTAFMTQSPQLYKQMMVPVFERVWTIAHAYRAEPSVTTRHLSETTQMDCELGFMVFEELMDTYEDIAVEMVKHAQEKCRHVFESQDLPLAALAKIPRLTLREAQEIIFQEFKRDARKEKDLSPQDEVDICKWAKEKYGSDFVTITHYPTAKRAFYTMPDPKNPEFSLSFDLLFRGIEVLSGSQRINDYQKLVCAIEDRGMDPKNFEMYLQAFKYGMPPEGGFSFGLERMTKQMMGLENIREASLFPRDMERVDFRFNSQK